jgi:hypothetical protein
MVAVRAGERAMHALTIAAALSGLATTAAWMMAVALAGLAATASATCSGVRTWAWACGENHETPSIRNIKTKTPTRLVNMFRTPFHQCEFFRSFQRRGWLDLFRTNNCVYKNVKADYKSHNQLSSFFYTYFQSDKKMIAETGKDL